MTPNWTKNLLLVCTLMLSCADAEQAAYQQTLPVAQCSSSADCAAGTFCQPPHQLCVATDQLPRVVAIVAEPPVNANYVPSHVDDLLVSPNDQIDLTLPQTVRVTGSVRVEGNLVETSVPSVLVAVAQELSVNDAVRSIQTTATDDGYELILQQGQPYEITVRIQDSNRPTYRTEVVFYEDQEHDFWLPTTKSYPVITGRIRQQADDGHSTTGIANLQVTAVHQETREQCTSTTTDLLGTYELLCPETAGYYRVLVSPAESTTVLPSFTARFAAKDEILLEGDRELPDILLGTEVQEVDVSVQVKGPNGGIDAISLTVSAQLADTAYWTDAVLRQTTTTQTGGGANLRVLRCPVDSKGRPSCTYDVHAVPHPTHELATKSHTDWKVDSDPILNIQLLPKGRLAGTVVSHGGQLAGSVRVEAVRDVFDAHTQTTTQLQYVTETDETGAFTLPVDPGEYTLHVVPEGPSGLPRWTDGPHSIGEGGATLQIQLARSTLLEGSILAPDGQEPVPNTVINVYETQESGERTLLGSGVSQENGHYLVVLPSL